jgi:hypothetical protein
VAGDFNLKISPNSRTIKQGSNSSFEIALVPVQGDILPEVSIRIIGLPERVSYNLINKSAAVPKTYTLIIITRENTPVGKYNFTIIGDAGGVSHTAWAIVEVTEVVTQTSEPPPVDDETDVFSFTFLHQIIFVAIFIVIIFLVFIRYLVRKQKSDDVTLDPKKDREYLGIARALARIEELRAADKLIEETYRKLKKEYEDKLEKTRKKD